MTRWDNVYPAIVRDVHDPMRSGRIRVECPPIYGVGKELWSPWCLPNFGQHVWSVPLEGDTVWIAFRMGDPNFPVWLGRYGTFNPDRILPEFYALSEGPFYDELLDFVEHAPITFDTNDHKKGHDHGANEFWDPYVHAMVFPMGAGLLVDEEPGEQRTILRDRVGQYLEFTGDPLEPKDPHLETRVGGEYDAPDLEDETIFYEAENVKTRMRLRARHSQWLEMRVFDEDKEEELELRSANIDGDHGSHLTFSNSELSKRFLLERFIPGYSQSYTAIIDPEALSTNFQRLFDSQGQTITINSDDESPDRYVEITNAPGETIKIHHDEKFILIEDRNGTKIEWDADEEVLTISHHDGDSVTLDGTTIQALHKTGSAATLSSAQATLTDGAGGTVDISASGISISTPATVTINTSLATVNGKPVALNGDPCVTPVGPGTVVGTGN